MSKNDFLNELREVLAVQLTSQQVEENVAYYKRYIEEQVNTGKTEAEVMDELGDARIIAMNVIDGFEQGDEGYSGGTNDQSFHTRSEYHEPAYGEEEHEELGWKEKVKVYGTIALILAIIFIVLALVTRLVIFLLPGIIVVAFVVWLIKKLG